MVSLIILVVLIAVIWECRSAIWRFIRPEVIILRNAAIISVIMYIAMMYFARHGFPEAGILVLFPFQLKVGILMMLSFALMTPYFIYKVHIKPLFVRRASN